MDPSAPAASAVTITYIIRDFDSSSATPGPRARKAIDSAIEMIVEEHPGYELEIGGYRDDGEDPKLGGVRANAGRRYVHERYRIPLERLRSFDFGSDQRGPEAARRVTIRVREKR